MKNIMFVVMLFFLSSTLKANEILISLYQYGPWKMVVGSDSPTFVLYENGKAIFWDIGLQEYQYVELDKSDVQDEVDSLIKLKDLKGEYSLSAVTDQPTQVLSFKLGNEIKKITIYGSLLLREVREGAPKSFVSKYYHFISYSNPKAKKWKPEYLEVMIWPFEDASRSTMWPKKWPNIYAKNTINRESSYSLFLPYDQYDSYKSFIKNKPKGAVLISGKKWSLSSRIPFPHELPANNQNFVELLTQSQIEFNDFITTKSKLNIENIFIQGSFNDFYK